MTRYLSFIQQISHELNCRYDLDRMRLDWIFEQARYEDWRRFEWDNVDTEAQFAETFRRMDGIVVGYDSMVAISIHTLQLCIVASISEDNSLLQSALFDLLKRALTNVCVRWAGYSDEWDPDFGDWGSIVYTWPLFPFPKKHITEGRGTLATPKAVELLDEFPSMELHNKLLGYQRSSSGVIS
ncbi:MAG: hypothetical protein RBU27_07990 [Bacteroidota bacterium]|nr:hypothetical protein [Bacteroidota bacterium]